MSKMKEVRVVGKPGNSRAYPSVPIVSLISGGKQSYLWIGNDVQGDMHCYMTLSGPVTLRKLAKAILREVGEA